MYVYAVRQTSVITIPSHVKLQRICTSCFRSTWWPC